jgi:hypothetical protein
MHRCRGENNSGEEAAATPEHIAELTTEDQVRGQRHQTAVQHPLDRLGADVVVPHYCGQRQRHGGLVDQNHRVRESRRRQNQTGMWRRADLSAHGGAPGDPM